jgi:ketosteroid isomerase-like protein
MDSRNDEQIRQADQLFLVALESLDAEKITECFSRSDEASLLFPGTDLARGPRAIRSAWEEIAQHTRFLRTMMKPVTVMRVGPLGWSFLSGSLVSTHGDETLTVDVYMTNIYRLESGGWKLLHHHSAPAPHQPSFLEQRLN